MLVLILVCGFCCITFGKRLFIDQNDNKEDICSTASLKYADIVLHSSALQYCRKTLLSEKKSDNNDR